MATTTYTGSPAYPGSPEMTVDALLQTPKILLRQLTDLTAKRFVADQIFTRGGADQVAGGAAFYQRSESIYLNRDPEEVGVRSEFPRAAWDEELRSAAVKKYGLEVPISFESARRRSVDVVQRANRKLANALVKFTDTLAMTLLLTDPDIHSQAASGDWTTAATDIISDLANAKIRITNRDEGYEADTLVVNPAQWGDLLLDKDIRDALPRETPAYSAVLSGTPVPILGFDKVIVTPQITAGKVVVLQSKLVGTIADESPAAGEGYSSYSPGAGFAPLHMKIRRDDDHDEWIVRAMRLPAMWIAEPGAAEILTGA